MNPVRLSVSALALTIGLCAAPFAQAAVFAQFSPDTAAADLKWVRSTSPDTMGSLFSIASAGASAAQSVATHFSFLDPALSALAFLPAKFLLDGGVTSPTPALINGDGSFTQQNVDGHFSFTYSGPTTTIGTITLTHNVTNLLSGVFTSAYITGVGSSGATNLSATLGGLTFTSDVEPFINLKPGTEEFAFNLLAASPQFGATAGKALNSFVANGGGNFSFLTKDSKGGVPEPAQWALMLTGFGMLGGLLRLRRRVLAA